MTTPLFESFTSISALWSGALRAARGKRHRAGVARTLLDLEPTVLRLSRELRSGTWRPGCATRHRIADPKPRVISAAPFTDRIVHQALCAAIGPLVDRHLIDRSFACRDGKGSHAAVRVATAWARTYPYAVHLDVEKFFPSIDHELLLRMLGRDIDCERTLGVCRLVLEAGVGTITPARFHFPGDGLFTPLERSIGLPIGNLTSQHFANRYLSPIDHRATDRLRIRGYLRYMDDMLLFGEDRDALCDQARDLEEACWKLRLRLHPWRAVPTRAGIGWLGFRLLPDCVRVKGRTVRRARARLARKLVETRRGEREWDWFLACLRSTFGHWGHADTFRLRTQTLRALELLYEEDDGSEFQMHPGAPPLDPGLSSPSATDPQDQRLRE